MSNFLPRSFTDKQIRLSRLCVNSFFRDSKNFLNVKYYDIKLNQIGSKKKEEETLDYSRVTASCIIVIHRNIY